jgi:RNA recognition motif-containing protein
MLTPQNTIFVANLPFSVDDEQLAAVFTNLSIKVKSAKVVVGIRRNRAGRPFRASRGFGFVEIEDPSQQKEAVEKVEGSLIGDRQISAKIANELKPIEQAEMVASAKAAEAVAGTEGASAEQASA